MDLSNNSETDLQSTIGITLFSIVSINQLLAKFLPSTAIFGVKNISFTHIYLDTLKK